MDISRNQKAEILRKRAEILARQKQDMEEDRDAYVYVVEFMLASEKYALELIYVSEVYPLMELTPVPCTPPFVLGIVNFRGQILSIIDLKKFFELPEEKISHMNRVIVLRSEEMEFGILADEIIGVSAISLAEIQSSVPTFTGVRAKYLKGVTKDRLVILDGKKILSDKNIVVNREV